MFYDRVLLETPHQVFIIELHAFQDDDWCHEVELAAVVGTCTSEVREVADIGIHVHVLEAFLEDVYVKLLPEVSFGSLHKHASKLNELFAVHLPILSRCLEICTNVLHHFRSDTVVEGEVLTFAVCPYYKVSILAEHLDSIIVSWNQQFML